MITSPPYNVTKEYDDDLSLDEYLDFLKDVLSETYRVLADGGIVAFNIANVGRKPYLPLESFVIEILMRIGYKILNEIIWNKGASAGGSCAWGSWMSASNPTLRDVHEYVIIAQKTSSKSDTVTKFPLEKISTHTVNYDNRTISVNPGDFINNVWNMGTESAKRVKHPAPFPVEFPYRVILFYSKQGDIILDPFMGSGSVAIAAMLTKRKFVGYEISEEYLNNANTRISDLKSLSKNQSLFKFIN